MEGGDAVAVLGHGSVEFGNGDPVDFTYAEVFTFTDRLDTFHVWLGEVPGT